MRKDGFSLIELLIIIAIMGILSAIGTLQFNEWTRKSNIESQVKMMFSDLMTVRAEALFQKKERLVKLTATQFTIYPANVDTDPPVLQKKLSAPLSSDSMTQITFKTSGLSSNNGSICIDPLGNQGAYDSIIVFKTRIQMGKWTEGGCSSANISVK